MKKLLKIKLSALDTNIFIYFFENHADFGQKAKLIFEKMATRELRGMTNITSLAEIMSSPRLNDKAVKETSKLFLSIPNLEVYKVDEDIATESAKIRREYGFRLLDAIQLATAKIAKAQAFITNDDRLKQFKELKIILLNQL